MTWGDLQSACIMRLDNRGDLVGIVRSFAALRIQYWAGFFFYSSEFQDTSILTQKGTAMYPLPSGMFYVSTLRFLLGKSGPATTTLSVPNNGFIDLPQSIINVASTTGFQASGFPGYLNIGGEVMAYTGLTSNTFTGVTGGNLIYQNGTAITQAGGVWVVLDRLDFSAIGDVLAADPVNPPFTSSVPSSWAQVGQAIRLFPTPSGSWQLEFTGSRAVPAPVNSQDINFWTTDAAELIIASTCAQVWEQYIGNPPKDRIQALRAAEEREYTRILKTTINMSGPLIIRSHF